MVQLSEQHGFYSPQGVAEGYDSGSSLLAKRPLSSVLNTLVPVGVHFRNGTVYVRGTSLLQGVASGSAFSTASICLASVANSFVIGACNFL